tara:strand:+ start:2458 stop:3414 length:957 start_codon:yes stop_codon:yes gene_type:complete
MDRASDAKTEPSPARSRASTRESRRALERVEDETRADEDWFDAFERTFIFRTNPRRDDAFDRDDVLHFVRRNGEVFVKRWSEDAVVDAEEETYEGVDWRATMMMNVCAQSAFEMEVGQFREKDRSDVAMTVRTRAYASPFYAVLDERGMPVENVATYPLVCFTFRDAVRLDARAGDVACVTVRRVPASADEEACSSPTSEKRAEVGDVVFATHAALVDETPTKLGRALLETARTPPRGRPRASPKRALVDSANAIRKIFKSSTALKGGGTHDARPGVELYYAGDGKYAMRSVLAPCVDAVYEIAVRRNDGISFGSMFG